MIADRLNHGHAVVTKVFDYFETLVLVVCVVVLRIFIVDTYFDSDGFFVRIRVLGRFNKWNCGIKSGIFSPLGGGSGPFVRLLFDIFALMLVLYFIHHV